MAYGLNKHCSIGNLGKDPEMSVTSSGLKVTKFSLAINEKYKEVESTTWINVVAFDKLAEIASQYLSKGSKIYVEGKLQIKNFDRQDGSKGTSVDVIANQIILLDKKSDRERDKERDSKPVPPPELTPEGIDDIPF